MASKVLELSGQRVLWWQAGTIADAGGALELIAEASSAGADWVAVPTESISPDFFSLRTGLAGAVTQKFVNYGHRLAVVGDVSRHVRASTAFRDFVREANRGAQLWFVADTEELEKRLMAGRAG